VRVTIPTDLKPEDRELFEKFSASADLKH
jgi:hypothetical protein